MAIKRVWLGSVGPYTFDDTDQYDDGVNQVGLRSETAIAANNFVPEGLSSDVRLVFSSATKEFDEVNDLTTWIIAGLGLNVIDNGDGTATVEEERETTEIDSTDSPYNLTNEYFIYADDAGGSIIINLPALSGAPKRPHIIKKSDVSSNTITISPDGTEQIEGTNEHILNNKYEYVELFPGPAEWLIIGSG